MGKGGVGKTTTAGALALAMARQERRTLLVSTDPAHSLGDLFGVALPRGRPVPSPCGDHLVVEELDADGYARRWIARARQPLLALFEEGTYLDSRDVEGFLDLTLPGVDEVAGVLRLAEISDEPWEGIVVDTAPTGHTLRLLDAGIVVRSWAEAFDAMSGKAAAVIGQLTRRPVRLEADDLVEDLLARVERFGERVLEQGAAVLVDRAGAVVEAETGRLERALRERGLPVALRVRVAAAATAGVTGDAEPPLVMLPFRTDLVGCEGLARWGEPPRESAAPTAAWSGERGEDAAAFLRGLPTLLLFVGKGGVGKSTCAAAAALALAGPRDVTLLGTDPAGSLEDVLGISLAEGEARQGALAVRQVRAAAEFQALRERYRDSVGEAFRAVGLERGAALDRRVMESLLGLAPPGLDEVFAVAALVEDVSAGRTVVVDTAPTGHFLRLVAMPEVALDWIRQLLRVIRRYRAVLGLDAFAERLLDFAKRLKDLDLTLPDPERSAALVVTQPGPLVAAESDRLAARLHEARIRVAAIVANRTPEGGPLPQAPPGVVVVRAPELEEPPVGASALGRFLETWTLAV